MHKGRFMNASRSILRPAAFALSIIIAACTAWNASAQSLTLGEETFGKVSIKAISTPVSFTPAFFGKIGGVAFNETAVGENGEAILQLRYDAKAPDGSRLNALVRSADGSTSWAVVSAPDWVVKPTASFANDNIGSCFTLFGAIDDLDGSRSERDKATEVLESGGRLLMYHAAFEDTLLGLRLLQGDLLIIHPESADLFKADGEYVLGTGESPPQVDRNSMRLDKIHMFLLMQELNGESFQSYVVTDPPGDAPIRFRVHEGQLVVSGSPYWRAWRYSTEYEQAMEQIGTRLIEKKIEELLERDPDMSEAALDRAMSDYIEREAEAIRAQIEREIGNNEDLARSMQMNEFSAALTRTIIENNGGNPAVFKALEQTMRIAAICRAAKAESPSQYAKFLDSIKHVSAGPMTPSGYRVETPTYMGGD